MSAPCIRIGGCLKPAPCLCDHDGATCPCAEHRWYRENSAEFGAAVRASAIREAVERMTDTEVSELLASLHFATLINARRVLLAALTRSEP